MLFPLILGFAKDPPGVDLVFNARFYNQGKKPSYSQIYLCRHDGTLRRQVTFANFNCEAPLWVDHNHIAYVEEYQLVRSNVAGEDDKHRCRIILMNVATKERRKLSELPLIDTFWGIWSDGNILGYEVTDSKQNGKTVRLRVGRRKVDVVSTNWIGPLSPVEEAEGMEKNELALGSGTSQTTVGWLAGDSAAFPRKIRVQQGAYDRTYGVKGEKVDSVFLAKDKSVVVITSHWDRKYDQTEFFYQLQPKTGNKREIAQNIGDIDFDPDRALYLAHQTGRREAAMEKLDDGRSLYVNWLYVGNWYTGRKWTIATGLVDVGSSQLRPP